MSMIDKKAINAFRKIDTVHGHCEECDEEAIMVAIVTEYYRCTNCGADTRQHINGSISNSDAPDVDADNCDVGFFFNKFAAWTAGLSADDREWLFAKSAEKFYRS